MTDSKQAMQQAKTSIQLEVDTGRGRLEHKYVSGVNYNKYREMRQDPTIALARSMAVAPILAAAWTVEGTDEEQVAYVQERIADKWRRLLVKTAAFGMTDFGWKGYEYVMQPTEVDIVEDDAFGEEQVVGTEMEMEISAIRSLKNDYTWALYNIKGNLIGLENEDLYTGKEHVVDSDHCLFINFDDEGLGDYGLPLMQAAMQPYEEWIAANEAAARYDKKIAGEHWIIYYPIGRSEADFMTEGVSDDDGMVSNDKIAAQILKQLCASGSVSVPVHIDQLVANLQGKSETGWKIELLSSEGLQSSFVDRLTYLDSLKVRSMLVPERAILEGQFGTKAEAEAHADMALVIRQLQHEEITEAINTQLVDPMMAINFDAKPGATKLVAMPLSDEKQALYKDLFMKLVEHPESSVQVLEGIDFDELRESLSIPFDPEAVDEVLESGMFAPAPALAPAAPQGRGALPPGPFEPRQPAQFNPAVREGNNGDR